MSYDQFIPVDPLDFARVIWPDRYFYSKQREIIYSVEQNNITVVPAGNKLGKDYVAGFIALSYFLRHPVVRVVCNSVKDDHLRVLFSEIQSYIDTSRFNMVSKKPPYTGCLKIVHRDIRKYVGGKLCATSYLLGMVSEKGEGLAGHHAPYTLAIVDEASGIDDIVFTQLQTWAKRILVIGNPLPTTNQFYKWVKGGDVRAPEVNTI